MTHKISRCASIKALCGGLGSIGLASAFAGNETFGASLRAPGPDFAPKAKHVIILFLTGGPSQLDMWDPKPILHKYAGQRPPSVDIRTERVTGGLLPSAFEFKKYGQSGIEVSDLLPNLAGVVDDLCVIRSLNTLNPTHPPAWNLFQSGTYLFRSSVDWRLDHVRARNGESQSAWLRGAEPGPEPVEPVAVGLSSG